MGLRDDILQSEDLPREEVAVEEWKCGRVWVRVLTGAERDAHEVSLVKVSKDGKDRQPQLDNVRARLLVKCLVDQDGKRVFEDADAAALGAKSGVVLDRLYDVALRVSKMRKEDDEELEKNSSPPAAGGGSSAASPATSGGPASNGASPASAPAS